VAKPVERGEFHDEFSEVAENFCDVPGLTVQIDTVVDGRFRVDTRGRGGLLHFAENVRAAGPFTNVDNGNVATSVDKVLNKDLKVIDNGDGTLTVILLATGNATLYDASGKAIGRNPGSSTAFRPALERIPTLLATVILIPHRARRPLIR